MNKEPKRKQKNLWRLANRHFAISGRYQVVERPMPIQFHCRLYYRMHKNVTRQKNKGKKQLLFGSNALKVNHPECVGRRRQ